MAKQQINRKETKVATQGGVGQQYEQVVTLDDNSLPTPKELADYKAIDPRIVDFLLESSIKEQEHRHNVEHSKVKIIKKAEQRITVMNWWGMFSSDLECSLLFLQWDFSLDWQHSLYIWINHGLPDLVLLQQ